MASNSGKVLLDPYGRGVVVPNGYNRAAASEPGDNAATAMKSVVVDPSAYNWEGDRPLRRPASQTIVYEMHVGGSLGITAVELLPVFQFDALACPAGLVNYWGYQPVSFFAPHQAFSARQDPLGPVDEFRDLVKALHRAAASATLREPVKVSAMIRSKSTSAMRSPGSSTRR